MSSRAGRNAPASSRNISGSGRKTKDTHRAITFALMHTSRAEGQIGSSARDLGHADLVTLCEAEAVSRRVF
jgi:hypothetical protein